MSGVPGCSWWRSPMTAVVHHSDGYVPKFSRRSPDNSHGSDGVHLGVRALAIHVPSPLSYWQPYGADPHCGFSCCRSAVFLFFSLVPVLGSRPRSHAPYLPTRPRPWSLLARSKCACPAIDARDHGRYSRARNARAQPWMLATTRRPGMSGATGTVERPRQRRHPPPPRPPHPHLGPPSWRAAPRAGSPPGWRSRGGASPRRPPRRRSPTVPPPPHRAAPRRRGRPRAPGGPATTPAGDPHGEWSAAAHPHAHHGRPAPSRPSPPPWRRAAAAAVAALPNARRRASRRRHRRRRSVRGAPARGNARGGGEGRAAEAEGAAVGGAPLPIAAWTC